MYGDLYYMNRCRMDVFLYITITYQLRVSLTVVSDVIGIHCEVIGHPMHVAEVNNNRQTNARQGIGVGRCWIGRHHRWYYLKITTKLCIILNYEECTLFKEIILLLVAHWSHVDLAQHKS